LGIKPYIAFYRVISNNVFIYRVLHGASNYPLLYEQMMLDLSRPSQNETIEKKSGM